MLFRSSVKLGSIKSLFDPCYRTFKVYSYVLTKKVERNERTADRLYRVSSVNQNPSGSLKVLS